MKPRLPSVLALVLVTAGSALAHHNMSALFDFNQVVTQTGTLAQLDWRNPHIYIFVDLTTPVQLSAGRSKDRRASAVNYRVPGIATGFESVARLVLRLSRKRDGARVRRERTRRYRSV